MKIIPITQAHIDQATSLVYKEHKRSDEFCPTCLSLRELFPDAKVITVGFTRVTIDGIEYDLNNEAYKWIHNWIWNSRLVQPTEFKMERA